MIRFAIYGKRHQERHAESLRLLLSQLEALGSEVVMHRKLYEYLPQLGIEAGERVRSVVDGDAWDADIAISIGGDGTFLRTAHWVAERQTPIIGINTGSLGYLAQTRVEDIGELIFKLREGRYKIESRSVIEVKSDDAELQSPFALNEVAILKAESASMIRLQTEIDGQALTTYLSDGLIVATPTGSTAYNLSVGGPILAPSTRSWAISPIAPHSLTLRPLVVSDSSVLRIATSGRTPRYRLALDGKSTAMPDGSVIELRKAAWGVRIIQPEDTDFPSTLRHKLLWGVDAR